MPELGEQIGGPEKLIRKLSTITSLSEAERDALRSLTLASRAYSSAQDIVREGDLPVNCCLVLDGFAYRYKLLADGSRQIVSFHVTGDLPDLQSLHLGRMDHSLGVVASTEIAFIPHLEVAALIRNHQGIATALWRDSLVDASIFREWIANIGARSAIPRIAHLFCELFVRMNVLGLSHDNSIVLPLTQADIGDATGLSTVHVNRSIQHLRSLRVIALRERRLHILNWAGLQAEALFDPSYLHLSDPPWAA